MKFMSPAGFEQSFAAWEKGIGTAAYRSWLSDAKSWVGLDGMIHIEATSAFRAQWIRNSYRNFLERIVAGPVSIDSPGDESTKLTWPHKSPEGGSVNAWWHNHERWPGDKLE